MDLTTTPIIYTVGHSTHSLVEFLAMLDSFAIKTLVDVRSLPGSRKFPQFDQDNMEVALAENGIHYIHLKSLGGRRKVQKDSKNIRWRNSSFRAYADYMETEEFNQGITELVDIARQSTTAIMCAESLWWRCHRAMLSDYLKAKGWTILHIMKVNKVEEHPYTPAARVEGDCVFYTDHIGNI